DQHLAHLAPLGTGLVRDQLHADHFFCELGGFVRIFGELDAAALASPARVDLRLDHHPPAQLLGRLPRVVGGVDADAARNRPSVPAKNVFGLVLVDFHRARVLSPQRREHQHLSPTITLCSPATKSRSNLWSSWPAARRWHALMDSRSSRAAFIPATSR